MNAQKMGKKYSYQRHSVPTVRLSNKQFRNVEATDIENHFIINFFPFEQYFVRVMLLFASFCQFACGISTLLTHDKRSSTCGVEALSLCAQCTQYTQFTVVNRCSRLCKQLAPASRWNGVPHTFSAIQHTQMIFLIRHSRMELCYAKQRITKARQQQQHEKQPIAK